MTDYRNMKFTEQERAILIEHRKKICDWIRNEIIPQMPHDSKIRIGFGGIYSNGWRDCDNVPMYQLVIHSEPYKYYGISGCGWKDEKIQIGIQEKFGRADNFEFGYPSKNPYLILPTVENWSTIKYEIKKQLCKLLERNSTIWKFEV